VSLSPTPSQTVGPFYAIGLCRTPDNELVPPDDASARTLVGTLFDGAGEPIVDGVVEVWDAVGGRWGRSGTDGQGRFSFVVAKPEPGPHGAPHLDVYVFARGLLKHQLTRIYFPDEAGANGADPVLASLSDADRATLVADEADGALRFDIRMQGEQATVFFVP
jgi:protocatechuate 3,4-dioxygenase alpha subunit